MSLKIFSVSFFLLLLVGSVFGQEKVVVFEFEGIGVDAQTTQAATHIFRNELNNTEEFTVISKQAMETALAEHGINDYSCYAVECASEYGYRCSAEKAVIGSLTKLGSKITAEIRIVSVVRKEAVFSDQFTAGSLDDLEMTLRRLAEAAATGEKITSETTRYTVTEEEAEAPRRKASYITTGVSLGMGFPLGDSYSGVSSIFNIAWMIRYEAQNWVVENSIGFSAGTGGEKDTVLGVIVDEKQIAVLPWDFGVRYVFNRKSDFTPFIGGGVGIHFISSQKSGGMVYADNDQAFAFHLVGGVYGFQSYDFRLGVELKYTMVFTDAFIGSEDKSHQIGINISISRKLDKEKKSGCLSGGCLF
ncbi:MAG: hypothetical protein JXA92_00015 [candidate division Zixibacteria bacterium]|nr:hypothetical protein [candidate division Zixibacteria bacterium]